MNKKSLLESNAVVVNAMTYFSSILKGKNNDYLQLSYKNNNLDIINGVICLRLSLGNYNNALILDFIVKPALFKQGVTLDLYDGFNFRKDRQGKKETNIQHDFNFEMFNTALNFVDKPNAVEFKLSNLILIKHNENVRILKPILETDINQNKVLLIQQRFLENIDALTTYKFYAVEKSSNDTDKENCYTKPLLIQNDDETVRLVVAPMLHAGKIA
jgi:hypothetical protein